MGEMTPGFDVSLWQDNNSTAQKIDFVKAYNAGIRFGMIKSSQALYQDEDILYNWKACKQAGILRTAYHFLDWVADPVQQARYAWSLIASDPPELPPMIDFESWNVVPANAEDKLWAYLQEMEALSKRIPMIYTGAFFWEAQANQDPKWKRYPLVIASYTTQSYMESNVIARTPWDVWTIWQYTSKGNGPGYGAESLNIDLDLFNGSYAQLLAYSNVTPPPPPAPAVDVEKVYSEIFDLNASIAQKTYDAEVTLSQAQAALHSMELALADIRDHTKSETDLALKLLKPGG